MMNPMVMLNTRQGFVWGYFQANFSVWKTTDGGQRWQRNPVTAPSLSPANQIIPVVDFRSSHVGWVAWVIPGAPNNTLTVLRTRDGGRHWTKDTQSVPPVVFQAAQITFLTNRDGWIRTWSQPAAFYQDPSILQTTTGGLTWTLVSSATVPNNHVTPDPLPDVTRPLPMVFTSRQHGWVAAGSMLATQATLYHTVTAGARWTPVPLPIPVGYQHHFGTQVSPPVFAGSEGSVLIQFIEGTTALGNAVVIERTTDQGKTWSVGTPLLAPGQSWGDIVSSFVTPSQGWVIGAYGRLFAETTTGGQSWQAIPIPRPLPTLLASHYRIQQLDMSTPKIGWLALQRSVGQNGGTITKFFKTTDGDRT